MFRKSEKRHNRPTTPIDRDMAFRRRFEAARRSARIWL